MSVYLGKQRQRATAQITATHGTVLQVIEGPSDSPCDYKTSRDITQVTQDMLISRAEGR